MEIRDIRSEYKFATRILSTNEEASFGILETESVWVCYEDDERYRAKVCRGTQDYVWESYDRLATTDEKLSKKWEALKTKNRLRCSVETQRLP